MSLRDWAHARAVTVFAGPIAQRRIDPCCAAISPTDRACIEETARLVASTPSTARMLCEYWRRAARDFVRDEWAGILMLAWVLHERTTLNGGEVVALIRTHTDEAACAARAWLKGVFDWDLYQMSDPDPELALSAAQP